MEVDLRDYLYVCYSVNLYNRFKNNNIRYFIKGINPINSKTFWIYALEPKVEEILEDWSNGVGK